MIYPGVLIVPHKSRSVNNFKIVIYDDNKHTMIDISLIIIVAIITVIIVIILIVIIIIILHRCRESLNCFLPLPAPWRRERQQGLETLHKYVYSYVYVYVYMYIYIYTHL